jgi:periplasmic protein TonB
MISAVIHVALVVVVIMGRWGNVSYISMPSVTQVQLVAMPDIPSAPPEEIVEQVEAETIPPPPEEKKRLKPKLKKETPKPKKQTASDKMVLSKSTTNQALSGFSSDEDFGEYPYYLRLMVNKISSNWINPYSGQAESVLATVFFRIARDGTVSDVRIEKSSGAASFDRAAQRAVLSSNPLPPLPSDYSEPQLTVHLDFEYKPQ